MFGPQDGVLSDALLMVGDLRSPGRGTGSEASGRRKHVAVDPVQLFEQVSHEVQGELPIGATNLISSSPCEATAERAVSWADFETFGGELFQVAGAPDLATLWCSLLAYQARSKTISGGAGALSDRGVTRTAEEDAASFLSSETTPEEFFTMRLPLGLLESWHGCAAPAPALFLAPSTWSRGARDAHQALGRICPLRYLGVPGLLALTRAAPLAVCASDGSITPHTSHSAADERFTWRGVASSLT